MRTHRLVGVCAVGLFFLSVQNLTRAASDELQVEYNARLGVTSRADLDQRLRAHRPPVGELDLAIVRSGR